MNCHFCNTKLSKVSPQDETFVCNNHKMTVHHYYTSDCEDLEFIYMTAYVSKPKLLEVTLFLYIREQKSCLSITNRKRYDDKMVHFDNLVKWTPENFEDRFKTYQLFS